MASDSPWALPGVAPSTPAPTSAPASSPWALPDTSAQTAATLRNNLSQAAGANPEAEAKVNHLARFMNVPPDSVRADQSTVQTSAAQQLFDAPKLAQQSPVTAQTLSNPQAMKYLHDDIPNVSATESIIRALAATRDYVFGSSPDMNAPSLAGDIARSVGSGLTSLVKPAYVAAGAAPVLYDKAVSAITGNESTQAGDAYFKATLDPLDAYKQATAIPQNASVLRKTVGALGELGPTLLAAMATGGASEAPEAGAGVLDAIGSMLSHGAKSMAIPATGAAVDTAQNVLDAGGSGGDATKAALTQYLASTAQGVIPLSAPGNLFQRTAVSAATSPLVSEAARQTMNAVLPQQLQTPFDPDEAIVNAVVGGVMGATMGPHPNSNLSPDALAAVRKTYTDAASAEHANQAQGMLQALGQLVTEGKFRERDPEGFHQFVENVSDSAGSPDLYIDARTLSDTLDKAGVTGEQLQTMLPDVAAQMREALQTEGMVRIPIDDYATTILGGPVDEALQPHLRTDPAGMTFAEAQEHAAGEQQALKDRASSLVSATDEKSANAADLQGVHDTILDRLNATGRFPADVNKQYAALARDYYGATAGRTGMKPSELFAAHPVDFAAQASGVNDQLDQGSRGLYNPGSGVITAMDGADLSTFAHELAHHFFETHARIAADDAAPEGVKSDVAVFLKHAGETGSVADWLAKPLDERRAAHETFARSFEAYLLEGKAPSVEAQTMFGRFRSWLLQVYKSAKALGVNLNPDVRAIFDRMLATDETIRQAESVRGMAPMFSEKPDGMSDEQFANYKQHIENATQTAVDELQAKSLGDMKWMSRAKSKALRDLQNQAKDAREKIRDEVTELVDALPAFQAKAYLDAESDPNHEHKVALNAWRMERDAQPRGQRKAWVEEHPQPERPRTDLDSWKEQHTAEEAKVRDAEKAKAMEGHEGIKRGQALQKAKRAINNAVDAHMIEWEADHPRPRIEKIEPDLEIAADKFGFNSADEMLQSIHDAGNRQDVIDSLTDQRMLQEHGELTDPQSIERAADAAIHNDVRARVIATELRALAKATGGSAGLLAKAAREAAVASLAGKKVGDIRVAQYAIAEGRAARAAEKAFKKGDIQEAAIQKRAQLLNNALERAAREAQDDIAAGLKFQAKFDKADIRKKLDGQFLTRIDEIRGLVDFRKNPPDFNRGQANLQTWADGLRAAGEEPQITEWLGTLATPQNYKDMTVEQFRGTVAAIKSLEFIARERQQATVGGKKVALRELIDGRMIPKLDERGERFSKRSLVEPPRAEIDGYWAALTHWLGVKLRMVDADLRPQEFKFNRYDLHQLDGVFREVLFDPFVNANYNKVDMTREVSNAAGKVGAELGRDWQRKLYDIVPNSILADPDLSTPTNRVPMKITRGRMLGIARHVGNESNFDKLTRGYGWAPEDVWKFLRQNMTAQDWRATQAHWDSFDPLWKKTEAMVQRLGGVPPPKIPAREFTITPPGGDPIKLRGGYSPLDYDPLRSKLAVKNGEFNLNPGEALGEVTAFKATTTSNGSLTNRAQGYTDRVSLDFHSSDARIRDTIHDLAYREALLDATKIVNDEVFRNKFMAVYGKEEYQALTTWLKNIRDTNIEDPRSRGFDKAMQYTRQGVVLTGIGYRLSTVAKHGGAAALKSLGYLGSGKGAKYFGMSVLRMANGWQTHEIAEAQKKFSEIRTRMLQMDRDYKVGTQSMYEPEDWRAKNDRYGHAMVAWSDALSAVPTAWAAYNLAKTEGVPESMGGTGKPMSEADAAEYANSIVRQAHGSALEVTRSNFVNSRGAKGLFGALYGFMNNTYGQMTDLLDKSVSGGHFKNTPAVAARLTATLLIPAVWTAWLTSGGPEGDESDAGWVGKAILAEAGAMFPFVRDAVSILEHGHAGNVAPIQAITDIVNTGRDLVKEAQGESSRLIQDGLNAMGEWGHIAGLGELGHILQHMRDVSEGKKQEDPNPAIEAKHLLVGG